MTAAKPSKKTAPKVTAAAAAASTTAAVGADAQLKKAIDDLDEVRTQVSTILQSLRAVASGQLKAPPAPPVSGPSVKPTPN